MNEEKKVYPQQELMTLKEAAEETGKSTGTLRRDKRLHKIRMVPLGPIRYLRSEVEQIKQERRPYGSSEYHQDNHT